jgi:hypothetical protein
VVVVGVILMQVSKPTLDFSLKKNDDNITIINNNRTMKDTQGELKVTVMHPLIISIYTIEE